MKHLLHHLGAHTRSLITRGKVISAKLSTNSKFTLLQLSGLAQEVRDQIRLFQPYGMSALPLAGGDLILLQVGGSRTHLIALAADDGSLRITDLQQGEFGWKDANAQQVVFRKDRLEITTTLKVVGGASEWDLTGDVKVTGKITATSDIQSTGGDVIDKVRAMSADRVKYNAHKHTGVATGSGTSGTTDTAE